MAPAERPWVLRAPRTAPPENPALRLFCFPPAGSGCYCYHGWEKALPSNIEVLPVELPGRNSRAAEAPHTSMDSLVAAALPALLPLMQQGPFALFGHSMGAWVAYALALALADRGGPLPAAVYASATRSPALAGPGRDVDPVLMHTLPPGEFWAAMERRYGPNPDLENRSLRAFVLPLLQADFRVVETYRPARAAGTACSAGAAGAADKEQQQQAGGGPALGWWSCCCGGPRKKTRDVAPPPPPPAATAAPRLPCRVVALGAKEDSRYTRAQLAAWRDVAPAPRSASGGGGSGGDGDNGDGDSGVGDGWEYGEAWFPGGHRYLTEGPEPLLRFLSQDLLAVVSRQTLGSQTGT